MSSLIAYLSVICVVPLLMLVGNSSGLNGWLKVGIVIPLILVVVYLLARIPPGAEKRAESRLVKVFEKSHNPG